MMNYYGGFIKSVPVKFSAIVFRTKDSIGGPTHLLFRSGKMNTMGAKTVEHAKFSAQLMRQYISQIVGLYIEAATNRIIVSDLSNRSVFNNFTTQLIVATGKLTKRPNLKSLLSTAQELSTWNPELFPGLRFKIWLRPQSKCKCVSKPAKQNCKCTVQVVIFDTKKIGITGARSILDINNACKLLDLLFDDAEFVTDDPLLPSHLRNQARKELLNTAIHVNPLDSPSFARRRRTPDIEKNDFNGFAELPRSKKPKTDTAEHSSVQLLHYAIETLQVDSVAFLLQYNAYSAAELRDALETVNGLKNSHAKQQLLALLFAY
jgi:TATA-box binding protein (TBP) (component of TFIID and TFIIIB)